MLCDASSAVEDGCIQLAGMEPCACATEILRKSVKGLVCSYLAVFDHMGSPIGMPGSTGDEAETFLQQGWPSLF